MNKIIKVKRLSTPDDIRKSIKFIVDQLEKQNYAYVNNAVASRLFARFCSDCKPNILVTPGDGKFVKSIVSINPDYYIERIDDFSFKLRVKVTMKKK
jgi:hypothetical protein